MDPKLTDEAGRAPAESISQSVSAPIGLEYQPATTRRWHVGTLTYTTAGLLVVVFWLLLADFGGSFKERLQGDSLSLLLRKIGASNTELAFLNVFLLTGIGMVLGPMIAYRSDRFRSRWGRRIPFLLVSVPIVTLSLIGIVFSPELGQRLHALWGSGSPGVKHCSLIVYGTFSSIHQLAAVCSGTVMTPFINDVIPRPVLGRFFGAYRSISLIVGVIANYFILGKVEDHFKLIFIAMALAYGVTAMLMCFMIKEGEYPAPREVVQTGPTWGREIRQALQDLMFAPLIRAKLIALAWVLWFLLPPKVREYVTECLSTPYYRWALVGLALTGIAALPVNWFSIYFAKKLDMSIDLYGKIKATNHMCGLLVAFPIGMLADRFHPLRVSMVAMTLYGITVLLGAMFIHSTFSFGCFMFGHMFLSGLFYSASGALGPVLLPRIKFAQFASAAGVLTSLATMAMGMILGPILDYTGSNYRLTYLAGGILAFATVAVLLVVHHKIKTLGGIKTFVAPEVHASSGFPVVMRKAPPHS